MKHGILAIAIAGTIIAIGLDFALARPPNDADPALAPWFESLSQPGTGISCCSWADCRPVDYRDHYEVFIDRKWIVVPYRVILQHVPNPIGRAVVCYRPDLGILCFVRARET